MAGSNDAPSFRADWSKQGMPYQFAAVDHRSNSTRKQKLSKRRMFERLTGAGQEEATYGLDWSADGTGEFWN